MLSTYLHWSTKNPQSGKALTQLNTSDKDSSGESFVCVNLGNRFHFLLRSSHRFPTNPWRQWQIKPPTPFGTQLPALIHEFGWQTSKLVVNVIGLNVVGRIGASHISPVKFGRQRQIKLPIDVTEHVPPLRQGAVVQVFRTAVNCRARNWKLNSLLN